MLQKSARPRATRKPPATPCELLRVNEPNLLHTVSWRQSQSLTATVTLSSNTSSRPYSLQCWHFQQVLFTAVLTLPARHTHCSVDTSSTPYSLQCWHFQHALLIAVLRLPVALPACLTHCSVETSSCSSSTPYSLQCWDFQLLFQLLINRQPGN